MRSSFQTAAVLGPLLLAAFAVSAASGCVHNGLFGTENNGGDTEVPPFGIGPVPSSCTDGLQDADETDVDCGGSCGQSCAFGQRCTFDFDCFVGSCVGGRCTPEGSTCSDRVRDGNETDIDCGGGCPKCAVDKTCRRNSDCVTGQCSSSTCQMGVVPFAFDSARFIDIKAQGPIGLAAADFDGDGKMDVAAACDGPMGDTGEVAVVLGRGDGTFQDPIRISLGAGAPLSIAAADFDRDGHVDLVLSHSAAGAVTVLFNVGGGKFQDRGAISVGGSARAAAISDLDGDGAPDLVVPASGASDLQVLLNRGGGQFDPKPATITGVGGITTATCGDFDGDGHPDVAVIQGYRLLLAAGDGRGGFHSATDNPTVGTPWYLAAAPLRKGGPMDLVSSSYDGTLDVLLGRTSLTLGPPTTKDLGGTPGELAIADMDGDGVVDLVAANQGPDTIQVLRGLGDGTFDDAISYYVGGTLSGMAVADFNADGKPDVALADFWTHDVGVMLNRSATP